MARVLPTLARIMLYAPENTDPGYLNQPGQRMAAMVTGVDVGPTVPTYDHAGGEETWVAVTVFPPSRSPFCRCVPVHFGDGDDQVRGGGFVEWMPYQKGQAAKTEELEAKASELESVLNQGNRLGFGPGPFAHSYGAGFPGSCEPVRERPNPVARRWLGYHHNESSRELRIALGGVDLILRQGMSDAVIYGALRTAAERVLQKASEPESIVRATKV